VALTHLAQLSAVQLGVLLDQKALVTVTGNRAPDRDVVLLGYPPWVRRPCAAREQLVRCR